jgi:hypothetical protein
MAKFTLFYQMFVNMYTLIKENVYFLTIFYGKVAQNLKNIDNIFEFNKT